MTTFDDSADRLVEPLRTNRVSKAVFGLASTIGDFSILWHIIGFGRAIGSIERFHQALALSITLGIESLIVNQGIKRLFRRERPTASGDHRFDVRTPSTSSFPSGHASSATVAAIVLTSFTGMPWAVVWVCAAAIVALSRVIVRIHHASDIIGGIVTGAILGSVALPIVRSFLG
jgi:membrane-associated phospholipid phosphatase